MSCDYCNSAKHQNSFLGNGEFSATATIDPVAEVIDFKVVQENKTGSFSLPANYCHICGAELQAVCQDGS